MKKSFIAFMALTLFSQSHTIMAQFNNPRNLEFTWKTDTSKSTVDLSEIALVLPKGSFPKIDMPIMLGKTEGLKSFYPKEPVIAVELNGEAKAYPLNMLTVHEISNDILGGVPILATYCPLCNAGVVFDRRLNINGIPETLNFEVSGMLRKSDMVMLDVKTESLWQQFMGEAIVGNYAGQFLEVIPSLIITVETFFERYPQGLILSPFQSTKKIQEVYGTNYYVGYDSEEGKPMERYFDHADIDSRLPAMERVIDIEVDGKHKIYPLSIIRKEKVINDKFRGAAVVIFFKDGAISVLDAKQISESRSIGTATVFSSILEGKKYSFKLKGDQFMDLETGSSWDITGLAIHGPLKGKQLSIEPHSNHFAFAWLSFFPESEIYSE